MTESNRDKGTFTKSFDVVSKNDDDQVVTGVIMSPMKVDRQGDWETPDTIQQFASDFKDLYENGSADGGIMHAAWPSEWMDLSFNGTVGRDSMPNDVPTTDLADGTWVQQWEINDDGLWSLIDNEHIQGFSIGARDVDWRGPLERDELPENVDVPEDYPDDEPVYELVDGIVREVSTVDTPAVQDALVLAKADAEKNLDSYLGDREGFIQELQDRGHSESAAEEFWDVMSRAAEIDGSESPGKESLYERIGRAAAKALPGLSEPSAADDAGGAETQTHTDKEGRTLSKRNRDSAKAAVDASLDLLEDAGVEHGMTRFTDRESDAFDLSEHQARTWSTTDDTSDTSDTEAMTDSDDTQNTDDGGEKNSDGGDPFEDAPAWASSLKETVDANTEQLQELKADDDDDDDDDDDEEEASAPKWAKALTEQVEANAEAVEAIGKQSGYSTQVRNQGQSGDDSKDASLANVLRDAGVQ